MRRLELPDSTGIPVRKLSDGTAREPDAPRVCGRAFRALLLIPAKDIQDFADEYVAARVIAKKRKLNGRSFGRYLRESKITLLKVPIPEKGRYEDLFVPKEALELLKGENAPRPAGQCAIPH